MRCPRSSILVLMLVASIARPAHAAWGTDAYSAHPAVCTATGNQDDLQAISDGAGGVIVAWVDNRGGASSDIYAQRISAAGTAMWTANGVVVINATGIQDQFAMVPDGAGGVILVWSDLRGGITRDLYAQRLNASGVRQWALSGVLVTGAANDQTYPTLAADGSGGAVIGWTDYRGASAPDVYAQRISGSGALLWTNSGITLQGVPVAVGAGTQAGWVVADGVGGAFVGWTDAGSGVYNIKAQRLAASTGLEMWTSGGLAVTTDGEYRTLGEVREDGLGGAILTWQEGTPHNMYGQRLDASGAKLWFSAGIQITNNINDQLNRYHFAPDGIGGGFMGHTFSGMPTIRRIAPYGLAPWANDVHFSDSYGWAPHLDIVADGQGGSVTAAVDPVGGVSAWRVSGAGVSLWGFDGVPLQRQATVVDLRLVRTTDGHFIAVWSALLGAGYDVFAERIDLEGAMGAPAPTITSIDDVPNDQGGRIRVAWARSDRDAEPSPGILDYRIWRSVPTHALASGALARQRGVTHDPDEAATTGQLLLRSFAAQSVAWELAGTQTAATLASYSLVTDTESDSVPGSFPRTLFMIEARTGTSTSAAHWFSAPDSGYSVDDLPPAVPGPFAAVYAPGGATLHWGANTEADLAYYRVYRGVTRDFEPNAVTYVGQTTDTTFADAAPQSLFYRLVAFDIHGNPSASARVDPIGAVDVPVAGPPETIALAVPAPHPVRAGAGAIIRFSVPRAGNVTLRLHDAQGRQRALLFEGALTAGRHQVSFTAAGTALTPGIYFLRIDAGGETRTRRVAITD